MLSYIYQTVWIVTDVQKDRFIHSKLVKVHEDLVSMNNSRSLKDDFDDLIYVNDSFFIYIWR